MVRRHKEMLLFNWGTCLFPASQADSALHSGKEDMNVQTGGCA